MAQADPLRILLIDDDPVLLQTLTDALDLYGFQTLASGSGAEGLAQVVARKPACVVVDIRMPEINGYQFCPRVAWRSCDSSDSHRDPERASAGA
jgi:CheY-like chemotaxis protein